MNFAHICGSLKKFLNNFVKFQHRAFKYILVYEKKALNKIHWNISWFLLQNKAYCNMLNVIDIWRFLNNNVISWVHFWYHFLPKTTSAVISRILFLDINDVHCICVSDFSTFLFVKQYHWPKIQTFQKVTVNIRNISITSLNHGFLGSEQQNLIIIFTYSRLRATYCLCIVTLHALWLINNQNSLIMTNDHRIICEHMSFSNLQNKNVMMHTHFTRIMWIGIYQYW